VLFSTRYHRSPPDCIAHETPNHLERHRQMICFSSHRASVAGIHSFLFSSMFLLLELCLSVAPSFPLFRSTTIYFCRSFLFRRAHIVRRFCIGPVASRCSPHSLAGQRFCSSPPAQAFSRDYEFFFVFFRRDRIFFVVIPPRSSCLRLRRFFVRCSETSYFVFLRSALGWPLLFI